MLELLEKVSLFHILNQKLSKTYFLVLKNAPIGAFYL